jgi:hypothetical protein
MAQVSPLGTHACKYKNCLEQQITYFKVSLKRRTPYLQALSLSMILASLSHFADLFKKIVQILLYIVKFSGHLSMKPFACQHPHR